MKHRDLNVVDANIVTKARELADTLGVVPFVASGAWLTRFKQRHKLPSSPPQRRNQAVSTDVSNCSQPMPPQPTQDCLPTV